MLPQVSRARLLLVAIWVMNVATCLGLRAGAGMGLGEGLSLDLEMGAQLRAELAAEMGLGTNLQTELETETGTQWNWRYITDYVWLVNHVVTSQEHIEMILYDIVNWKRKLEGDATKKSKAELNSNPSAPNKNLPPPPNIQERSFSAATSGDGPPPGMENNMPGFLRSSLLEIESAIFDTEDTALGDMRGMRPPAPEIEDVISVFLEAQEAAEVKDDLTDAAMAGSTNEDLDESRTSFIQTALEAGTRAGATTGTTNALMDWICGRARMARDSIYINRDYMKILRDAWKQSRKRKNPGEPRNG